MSPKAISICLDILNDRLVMLFGSERQDKPETPGRLMLAQLSAYPNKPSLAKSKVGSFASCKQITSTIRTSDIAVSN
jgi:hypothetical protein